MDEERVRSRMDILLADTNRFDHVKCLSEYKGDIRISIRVETMNNKYVCRRMH